MQALLCEEPDLIDEAGNGTCGEGAPAEAKEEDFVTRMIVVGEKGVAFPDGVGEAFTCCTWKGLVMSFNHEHAP
jgi:hypothetical protein